MSAAKVMPRNLAMYRSLTRHPSVEQLFGMSTLRTHHVVSKPSIYDSLRSRASRSPQIPASPVSTLNRTSPCGTLKKKKRVVFADDKGLALTSVRIFNADPPISDAEELSPPVSIKTESPVQTKKPLLRLGFSQPSADLSKFLDRLATSLVHLESCSLIYGSLFGKVRVCNITAEKSVHIRITYDSWRSHQDIPCTPIQHKIGSAETELFVFNIPVPSCPNANDHVEFLVTFRPGSGNLLLYDNNQGKNYRIFVEEVKSEEVSLEEKKPLVPKNFQSPQSLPLRNGSALYNSAKFSPLTSPKNMLGTLSRKENIMPISNSLISEFTDSNNSDR